MAIKFDKKIYVLQYKDKCTLIPSFDELINSVIEEDLYDDNYNVMIISDEFGKITDNKLLKESIKTSYRFKNRIKKELNLLKEEMEKNKAKIETLENLIK